MLGSLIRGVLLIVVSYLVYAYVGAKREGTGVGWDGLYLFSSEKSNPLLFLFIGWWRVGLYGGRETGFGRSVSIGL